MIDIMTQNILNLSKTEQDAVFKMLSENANILIKVLPNAPLLAYIVSGSSDDNSPIAQAYAAWKIDNKE